MARGIRISAVVLVAAAVVAGCTWPRARYDGANTAQNPLEQGLTAANVGRLAPVFRAETGVAALPTLVVGAGHLFASGPDTAVSAFDASGFDGCTSGTPRVCTAQWTFGEGRAEIVGNMLFTESRHDVSSGPDADYDATGVNGCGGTPKTCAPALRDFAVQFTSNTVDPNRLRFRFRNVSGGRQGQWYLDGYDRNDELGCGPPSMPGCSILWSVLLGDLPAGGGLGGPAVGAGLVFSTVSGPAGGQLAAWSPTPGPAVWTASLGGQNVFTPALDPVVAGDLVFAAAVDNGQTRWLAFDAAGNSGCSGSPRVCTPLWTTAANAGTESDVAVANGLLYRSVGGVVEVYDATGTDGCTGAPKVCAALWRVPSSGTTASAPVVAGSLLYVGAGNGAVRAFDASGETGCSGSPRQCTPLWDADLPAAAGQPVVVNGVVYVPTGDGNVTAFRVPS